MHMLYKYAAAFTTTHIDMERVVVLLHVSSDSGGAGVKKVWRFDTSRIENYTRASVEAELVQLFPDVARKELKFNLWYEDDLAGKVIMFAVSILCKDCKSL